MIFSKTSLQGELTVHNPEGTMGIPAFLPDGTAVAGAGMRGGGSMRMATYTCPHCRVPFVMNPDRTRERHYCRKCDSYVCDNIACHSEEHMSFDERIDRIEKAILRGQANRLVGA